MWRKGIVFILPVGALAMVATVAGAEKKVRILDACDPATFNDTFGPGVCVDVGGDVTVEEFLSPDVLPEGHPAWTNEPSYIRIKPGEEVKVSNEGGDANAPNPALVFIPSGGKLQLTGLGVGMHLFECCIHPWMSAAIKVEEE